MPYILLAVLVVLLALSQFGMYAGYKSIGSEMEREGMPRPQQEQAMNQMESALSLPHATSSIFSLAEGMGAVLLVILASSIVGAEYSWGTVRTTIIRGMGRMNYLLSKLATIMGLTLVGLTIAFLFGFIFSIITTVLMQGSLDWGSFGTLYVPRLLAMFGRTWFVLAVPISMATMAAVLTRSSAMAIGVGIGYPILEAIVMTILAQISGWGEVVQQYSIGYNINAVLALNSLDGSTMNVGINFGNNPDEGTPAFWRSGGLLSGYILAFLAISFYSFRKRDLTV
jgi:ABC-type transport system involved in multi-copper enzyme maturation permease subunit